MVKCTKHPELDVLGPSPQLPVVVRQATPQVQPRAYLDGIPRPARALGNIRDGVRLGAVREADEAALPRQLGSGGGGEPDNREQRATK